MLHNAYFLAKIVAVTAENERTFAEICQNWQLPYGPSASDFEATLVKRALDITVGTGVS